MENIKEYTFEEALDILNRLNEDESKDTTLILKDGETEVGTAMLRDYLDGEIFLTNFEVYPEFRGKGLGTKLFNELVNEHGVNSLTVAIDNDKAKHIYDKAGFKVVGEPYYDENAEAEVYYMKREK